VGGLPRKRPVSYSGGSKTASSPLRDEASPLA
jgi:hypothetical protein